MRQVAENLPDLSNRNGSLSVGRESEESIRPRSEAGSQRAARVWNAMKQLYGSAFLAAYGDAPTPIWAAAISELTDAQCRQGLASLAKQAREYPANLTQFLAACKPVQSPRFLGVPTTGAHLRKLLDVRRASPEAVDGWLAKMRQKVGKPAAVKREAESRPACTCRATGTCDVCQSYSRAIF